MHIKIVYKESANGDKELSLEIDVPFLTLDKMAIAKQLGISPSQIISIEKLY